MIVLSFVFYDLAVASHHPVEDFLIPPPSCTTGNNESDVDVVLVRLRPICIELRERRTRAKGPDSRRIMFTKIRIDLEECDSIFDF